MQSLSDRATDGDDGMEAAEDKKGFQGKDSPVFGEGSLEFQGVPEVTYHHIDLPKTRLHYIKCGEGPPLVMVPATISRVDNWKALTQFMGQCFTAYFFELPGHGGSTPFPEPFTTRLVAETVEDFIDQLGHETITLMGFSFGGILTLKTLEYLNERVEKVVIISPATSSETLSFSSFQRMLIKAFVHLIRNPAVRSRFLDMIHGPRSSPVIGKIIRRLGNVEETISMKDAFSKITDSTCEVLAYQVDEVLKVDFPKLVRPYRQPCFFAMSVNDPMMDYGQTRQIILDQFENVFIEEFDFPYHQPPNPFTFDELNGDYGHFLQGIQLNSFA